eukprot:3870215-Amphidinium_carterae.1
MEDWEDSDGSTYSSSPEIALIELSLKLQARDSSPPPQPCMQKLVPASCHDAISVRRVSCIEHTRPLCPACQFSEPAGSTYLCILLRVFTQLRSNHSEHLPLAPSPHRCVTLPTHVPL